MDFSEIFNDPEIMDHIISRIAEEVIRRLNSMPKKALVLFSGGAIGYNEAVENINKLKADNYEITVFANETALEIFGENKLQKDLGVDKIYSSKDKIDQKQFILDHDVIILGVMTINTAAKLALGIADNLLLTLVRNAILFGKDIITCVDAACPDNKVRKQMGMDKENQRYHDLLHNYLVDLASYGIWLTNAEDLYDAVIGYNKKSINKPKKEKKAVKTENKEAFKQINKHVISRRDVLTNRNYKTLSVPADALITQSALDLADELGIEFDRF